MAFTAPLPLHDSRHIHIVGASYFFLKWFRVATVAADPIGVYTMGKGNIRHQKNIRLKQDDIIVEPFIGFLGLSCQIISWSDKAVCHGLCPIHHAKPVFRQQFKGRRIANNAAALSPKGANWIQGAEDSQVAKKLS